MTPRFAAHAPDGRRAREMRVGGEPMECDRVYNVADCEREGDEPDKLCRIPHVRGPRVPGTDAHEAMRCHLARHSPLPAPEGRRVIAEDLPPVVQSDVLTPEPGRAGGPRQ
jgi:sulfur-oxidizing protein SoxB